jgi:hypothetical protein
LNRTSIGIEIADARITYSFLVGEQFEQLVVVEGHGYEGMFVNLAKKTTNVFFYPYDAGTGDVAVLTALHHFRRIESSLRCGHEYALAA